MRDFLKKDENLSSILFERKSDDIRYVLFF